MLKYIDWIKINKNWFQKVTYLLNKSTFSPPIITYHYKIKNAKQSIAIQFDTYITNQIAGYTLIEKDIRVILDYITEYERIDDRNLCQQNEILLKALMQAIIITYGKCFKSVF